MLSIVSLVRLPDNPAFFFLLGNCLLIPPVCFQIEGQPVFGIMFFIHPFKRYVVTSLGFLFCSKDLFFADGLFRFRSFIGFRCLLPMLVNC